MLVHGYLGYGPDQSKIMDNYFYYALENEVINQNYIKDIYVAVMSPLASTYDRACELYQQIEGIDNIRRRAGIHKDDIGPKQVAAVYGPAHAA